MVTMIMKVNPTRQVAKLIKELREWCAELQLDERDRLHEELRKRLISRASNATARAALHLTLLANWHGAHGSLAVISGQFDGWAELDRVLHYTWWSNRIAPSRLVASVALCLAHAMAFEEDWMVDWLGERMVHSMADRSMGPWEDSPFGVFMVTLWAFDRCRAQPNLDRPDVSRLQVYQQIWDAWSNPDQLRDALSEACDFHLSQSRTAMGYPAFVDCPYQLLPVDILAIAAVRRRHGLEMPQVKHPLLATPLAVLPPANDRPRMGPDPWLDKFIAMARETGSLEGFVKPK